MAVVCSYSTITRHLPPFGATANVKLLTLTHLTFSWGVLLTFEKMIQIRLLAFSYFRTVLKQNNIQVFRLPSCHKTTHGSLQNVSWTRICRPRKPWVLCTTLLLESHTSLQTPNSPQMLWHPGGLINLREDQCITLRQSRALNLPQTVTICAFVWVIININWSKCTVWT
jgi:hypothetical protein